MRLTRTWVCGLLCWALLFCGAGAKAQPHSNTVFQWSTITALMAGVFDGNMTFQDLRRHGDMGIGTVNGLDGEMVELNGQFYQIRADGHVYHLPPTACTPFAEVTFFHPQQRITLTGVSGLKSLVTALDRVAPNKNLLYVFRIKGVFSLVRTRSIPRQHKPYPTLLAASAKQKIFDLNHIRGTLVGFRMPDYMAGVNVTGYHFHFLSDDRKVGGHVLDCAFKRAIVETEISRTLELRLPASASFRSAQLGHQKRGDVEKVENIRAKK